MVPFTLTAAPKHKPAVRLPAPVKRTAKPIDVSIDSTGTAGMHADLEH
jgi:hypothetical protein